MGRGRPFRLALPVLAGAEKGGQGTRARGAASGSGGDGEEGKGKYEKYKKDEHQHKKKKKKKGKEQARPKERANRPARAFESSPSKQPSSRPRTQAAP